MVSAIPESLLISDLRQLMQMKGMETCPLFLGDNYMLEDLFAKTRYYTPDECIYVFNKQLEFVLLPDGILRPNGREFRKLMEIINNGKEETT